MKKLLKLSIFAILLLAGSGLMQAQLNTIRMPGRGNNVRTFGSDELPGRDVKGVVVDSLSSETLPSAVVSLVFNTAVGGGSNISVQNATTNEKGEFTVRLPFFARQARIEISYIGYKLKTVYLDTDMHDREALLLGKIKIAEDPEEMDKIVVRARIEMFKMKGDTMVFFPAAVKTMEGDAAIEILRAMPGVEVLDDGNIVVGQDTVRRTYVNNRLIFGDDPRMAFKHVEANKVQQILAYDEVDEESAVRYGEENADVRKVMNVLTFEKFDTSITGAVSAGGGADFNKDTDGSTRGRYMGLAEANMYNEKHRLTFSGGVRNSQRVGTSDDFYYSIGPRQAMGFVSGGGGLNRYINANLGYGYTSEDQKTRAGANYTFSNTKSRNSSNSVTDFFEKENEFQTRVQYDTTRSESLSGSHRFSGNYTYIDFRDKMINANLSAGLSYSSNDGENSNINRVVVDGQDLDYSYRNNADDTENISFNLNGSLVKRWKITALDGSASFNTGRGRGDGLVRREYFTTGITEITTKDTDSDDITARGSVGFSITPENSGNFRLGYDFTYTKNKSDVLAIKSTGEIDESLSRDQLINNLTNNVSLGYNYSPTLKHRLSANVNYENVNMLNDDKYSAAGRLERTFNTVSPSVNYIFVSEDQMKQFRISGNYRQSTPSLTMFSDRVDASNDMSLRAGNPDLKRSGNLNFGLSGDITTQKSTIFGVGGNVSFMDNSIIGTQEFFYEDTYLPQYDITAKAGSSLSSYVNGDGYESYGVNANFSTSINPIKSTLRLRASYNYSNPQTGIVVESEDPENPGTMVRQHRIVRMDRNNASFNAGLQTNFSSQVRLSLNSRTSYSHTTNYDGRVDRQIAESLSAEIKWDLLSRFNISAYYSYNYSRNSTNPEYAQNDHILNASVRCRIFKNRRGAISFNAYDILNNQSNYSSSVSDQYIMTRWAQTYSSYFTVNFEYRFNLTK